LRELFNSILECGVECSTMMMSVAHILPVGGLYTQPRYENFGKSILNFHYMLLMHTRFTSF